MRAEARAPCRVLGQGTAQQPQGTILLKDRQHGSRFFMKALLGGWYCRLFYPVGLGPKIRDVLEAPDRPCVAGGIFPGCPVPKILDQPNESSQLLPAELVHRAKPLPPHDDVRDEIGEVPGWIHERQMRVGMSLVRRPVRQLCEELGGEGGEEGVDASGF